MRQHLIALLLATSLLGAIQNSEAGSKPPEQSSGPHFVIGISPFLDKSVKDDVYRGVVRLLVEDLPLGSTLAIYDAFELKTITRLNLPAVSSFSSPKTRANQFAPAIRDLKTFLAQDHRKPTAANLTFDSAIRLPQFLDFVAETTTNSTIGLLLLGSPLYQDAKEPAFSMVDGYFPSDGHLKAARERSVFGYTAPAEPAALFNVRWIYFGDPWVNDLHQEKVTRFWTLYLQERGAQLAVFTADLPTALQNFSQNKEGAPFAKRWSIDRGPHKVEMLRVGREVEVADWLTRDHLPHTAQTPPSTMVGPMKIGIRWKANVDVDLYATPKPGAETLFFHHVRTAEGYYYKDHRSSPGKEYEFIEFESPVDVREVEAYVNLYKGSCPGGPKGEVRIEFDGRIYAAPFAIAAEEGNLGRMDDSQHRFWMQIPVQTMLKLAPGPRAGLNP